MSGQDDHNGSDAVLRRVQRQLAQICMPDDHTFGDWVALRPDPPNMCQTYRYCTRCGKYEIAHFVDLEYRYD